MERNFKTVWLLAAINAIAMSSFVLFCLGAGCLIGSGYCYSCTYLPINTLQI